jgi:hypothetical protein
VLELNYNKKFVGLILAGLLGFMILTGGACGDQNQNKAQQNDRKQTNNQLIQYQQAQPVPFFKWSQYRQTLIDIESAQTSTTHTTSFFFNQGVQDPIQMCESIGFPLPETAQLTSPWAKVQDHDLAVPQAEANGVYTGDTTATSVICISPEGKPYIIRWEGFVHTLTIRARWDTATHSVVPVGSPTTEVQVGK